MNYSMNSEHLRKFGNYKNDIMNDIFLIKPPPPVTKVVGKFFNTPDRINFYAATFCCDECCNPEHRWKFFVILLHRLLHWYSFHYRHLTHDDDTDRHFVCFFNWYNDIFFCVFVNLYAKYLSNRDNFDVFRNSNWNGHLWESFSHKWYLHKNKSESPKWVRT